MRLNPRQQAYKQGRNKQPNYHKKPATTDYGDDWPKVSAYVRKRDNYCCMAHKLGMTKCSNRFPPPLQHLLHAHHITSRSKGGSNHPKNVITLCIDCHSKEHGRRIGRPITQKQKAFGRLLR